MSLLRDIQDATIDANIDISIILRKCKVLSARLGNEDFKKWVDSELNGYKNKNNLPDYRILKVNSKGNFMGLAESELRNADIPMTCLPEKHRESFRHSYLMEPIASYVSLIKSSKGDNLQERWSPDYVALIQENIYENMACMSAWKVIPHNSIVALVEAVRNRILSFVLQIECEAPDAGEAEINSNPIAQKKVTQVFTTYISGNVQNVATGSTNVTQSGGLNVQIHDIGSLEQYLTDYGVSNEDIEELRDAIERDKKKKPKQDELGNKVMSWMTKMINKAAKGTWNVSKTVATSVITNAITSYYDL